MSSNKLTDPETFRAWKDHRLTKAFLQYLRDHREHLKEQWAAGAQMSPQVQAQADLMGQLCDLDCDAIRRFYDLEPINDEQ